MILSFFRSDRQIAEDRSSIEGLLSQGQIEEATAYSFLLTELAISDGKFDEDERKVIQATLSALFPDSENDAANLIKIAENLINNYREPSSFIARIREEYSLEERERLFQAIDKVISADSFTDETEKYLREKFRAALI